MDMQERLRNAEQHSLELHASFSDIEHRLRNFESMLSLLGDLRASVGSMNTELAQLKSRITAAESSMQAVARKEELKRFEEHLDAIPFERLATRKDI